jgi:hypothetical protein
MVGEVMPPGWELTMSARCRARCHVHRLCSRDMSWDRGRTVHCGKARWCKAQQTANSNLFSIWISGRGFLKRFRTYKLAALGYKVAPLVGSLT